MLTTCVQDEKKNTACNGTREISILTWSLRVPRQRGGPLLSFPTVYGFVGQKRNISYWVLFPKAMDHERYSTRPRGAFRLCQKWSPTVGAGVTVGTRTGARIDDAPATNPPETRRSRVRTVGRGFAKENIFEKKKPKTYLLTGTRSKSDFTGPTIPKRRPETKNTGCLATHGRSIRFSKSSNETYFRVVWLFRKSRKFSVVAERPGNRRKKKKKLQ